MGAEWWLFHLLRMRMLAIDWRLGSLVEAVIAHYVGNAQMIVVENLRSTFGLGHSMLLQCAPLLDRFFVTPKGQ